MRDCCYCDRIIAAAPGYHGRLAEFDLGSEMPRCAWHWRMRCSHCGEFDHVMSRFYCPASHRLLCRDAGTVSVAYGDFWAYDYWWTLACPDCGDTHPSLDRAEFDGLHPWQRDAAAAAARRYLSTELYLVRYAGSRTRATPMAPRPAVQPEPDLMSLDDADSDANWSANADTWEAGYDERGDRNRRYYSDPVLLTMLGDVAGQRVLDAGSGAGYLSRLLARRGAQLTAVENARRFHEIALAYQAREPLDIAFHHASLSQMPFLPDAAFDAVVANYVLMDVRDYQGATAEIARVLKPGGRVVLTLTHGTNDTRWHWPAPDSPRREDRVGWLDDRYFVRRAGYSQWGDLAPVLGFDRPLRDYIAALKAAGLELRDLDEPELSDEGQRILPAPDVREAARIPVSYALRAVKL